MKYMEFIFFFRNSTSSELANEFKNIHFKLIENINNYKTYIATRAHHTIEIMIFPNNNASIMLTNLPFTARTINILDFKENLLD